MKKFNKNVEGTKSKMYTIERNYCDCHPDTCNCNPWIIKKAGNFFVTIYSKEDGELIVKAMNEMERRKKL
jgi:hypothetical protein